MRIGIDARMFHKAGIRRYVKELILNLSKIDLKNQYIVYLSSMDFNNEFKGLNSNFRIVYLKQPNFSIREQLSLILQLQKEKLDLLHTTFDFGVPLWPVSNVVVTVHDAFFGPNTFFKNYKTRMFYQLLTRYSVSRSSKTIVISDFIQKKLFRYLPNMCNRNTDKIKVIPNGVGIEFFPVTNQEELEQLKRKYNITNKYIFCVGSFASKNKNLLRILAAFCKLPTSLIENYRIVIAGEMLNRVPEVMPLIKELKAKNFIICLGYIPDQELPVLYRNAEIFIFPSLHEGFGIPILEAMASGTPVITSNITAMPEIAGNAALLVDPFNCDEIRDAIVKILTTPHVKKELSEKGIRRAKEFSWSKTAQRTLEVYEEFNN